MKGLSIEEKAKAYDEAIERMKSWARGEHPECFTEAQKAAEFIFPELKESEDEKIRKSIIEHLEYLGKYCSESMPDVDKWIAWLEKQGEQKHIVEMKSAEESLGIDSETYNKIVDECIYGENKPVDKAEPKFHEGDWLVNIECGNIVRVIGVLENNYRLDYGVDTIGTLCTELVDNDYRLWTINDAKDGDVLAVEQRYDYPSPFIAIYKEGGLDFFNSHCSTGFDEKFYTGETGHDVKGIHPATKEQRDTLMKAMADAGYTFDFEKKELKKIEEEVNGEDYGIDSLYHAQRILEKTLGSVDGYQSDDGILDHKAAITAVKKLYEQQKTAEWSEDDEVKINRIVACLENLNVADNDILLKDVDWLKTIKDRVQPQLKQEWSEEDETKRNVLIGLVEEIKSQPLKRLEDWDGYISWLKSLRPQNH
jgi:hypothetical protein